MLVIGLILGVIGLGFYGWLLFTFAAYALPVFAGLTAGLIAYHSGAGAVGAIILAVFAGATTLALGEIALAKARTPLVRAAITGLYAAPATVAGYHATLGLAHLVIPSEGWRVAFAIVGAGMVGAAAWGRLPRFIPPTAEQGVGKDPGQPLSPLRLLR